MRLMVRDKSLQKRSKKRRLEGRKRQEKVGEGRRKHEKAGEGSRRESERRAKS